MNNKCSICGYTYETLEFKNGYVCESCIDFLKNFTTESKNQSEFQCEGVENNLIASERDSDKNTELISDKN